MKVQRRIGLNESEGPLKYNVIGGLGEGDSEWEVLSQVDVDPSQQQCGWIGGWMDEQDGRCMK